MTITNNQANSLALVPDSTDLTGDPLLTAKEGARFLTISEPTCWRHVGNGNLPKPIKLGNLSRWPQSELVEVIARAKSTRNA